MKLPISNVKKRVKLFLKLKYITTQNLTRMFSMMTFVQDYFLASLF